MGGAVSHGCDNNELISNLCSAQYIKCPRVEFAMRAVDRGVYCAGEHKGAAYCDMAFKNGDNHVSAPSIYCEVLEALDLHKGLSFLNIGSGTGYLSTIAGLLLASNDTNHGIDICQNVVEFAREKLQDFLKTVMPDILGVEFCQPAFIVGDGLCIDDSYRHYDRVYCGAEVDIQYLHYMKSLLNVDGILVVPCNGTLKKIHRLSEVSYDAVTLLAASFAAIVQSTKQSEKTNNLIKIASNPLQLQEICRVLIRHQLGVKCLNNLLELRLPLPPQIVQYLVYK